MTGRQFDAWQAWLEMDWDIPARSDWYVMRLIQAVMTGQAKNPPQDLNEYKLKFSTDDKPKHTKEQVAAWSKARWLGIVGMGKKAPPEGKSMPGTTGTTDRPPKPEAPRMHV